MCDICRVWAILVSMFPSFPHYKEGTGGRGQNEPGPPMEKQLESSKESDDIEAEIYKAIENAQSYLKAKYKANSSQSNTNYESSLPNVNNSPDNNMPPQVNISPEVNTSSNNIENNQVNNNTAESTEEIPSPSFERNYSRLKPLKVPSFDGDKTKFEDFWLLFESLVDCSKEPVNIKMARLR